MDYLIRVYCIVNICLFSDTVSNHAVVNCESRALKNHCYWPIVSDFINVLSHKSIAEMFMQNDDLIRQWMKFIEHLTGKFIQGTNNKKFRKWLSGELKL